MESICKVDPFGSKSWYNKYGQLHRENGPAVECLDGYKAWWVNNQRHRIDGPACEYADGTKSWWINGQHVDPFIYEGEQLELFK